MKYALDEANIVIAVGGVDFSFNEDRDGEYLSFWCVHPYVICSIEDAEYIGSVLRRFFKPSKQVPKPIKIPKFNNKAWRRSYALKMHFKRRIGFTEIRTAADGKHRECRNTSTDKLRAIERLELFPYLNQIGLEARVIFRGAKPVVTAKGVLIRRI